MSRNPQLTDEFSAMVRNIPGLLGRSRASIIASMLRGVSTGRCSAKDAIEIISSEMKRSEPDRAGKEITLDPDSPYDWALLGVYGGPDQIRAVAARARKELENPAPAAA
jgi:hypothetical protein